MARMLLCGLAVLLVVLVGVSGAYGEKYLREVPASEVEATIRAGQPAEYDNCVIVGVLNLRGIRIIKPLHFNHAVFQNDVIYNSVKFEDTINFSQSQFKGNAEFMGSQFNGYSIFRGSQFNREAFFGWSHFMNDAIFGESQFNEYAAFLGSHFEGHANFSWSQFNDYADFSVSQFNSSVEFSGSQFNSYADFSRSKFKGPVVGCDSFNRYIDDKVTYLSLIQNLKDHGQFKDADDCYYASRFHFISEPFDYLSWISCGFGVRPSHPLGWSIVFIFLFGLIFWKSKCIHESPCPYMPSPRRNPPKALISQPASNLSFWQALYFSLLTFFHTHPPAYWHPAGRWKYLVTFEDILGWFLLALFTVVLVNVMITR